MEITKSCVKVGFCQGEALLPCCKANIQILLTFILSMKQEERYSRLDLFVPLCLMGSW